MICCSTGISFPKDYPGLPVHPVFFQWNIQNFPWKSTPEYINYFFSLSEEMRNSVLSKQDMLYKGINYTLINEIYDLLYIQGLDEKQNLLSLHTNCELKAIEVINEDLNLSFHHNEIQKTFYHTTDALILATGYKSIPPKFLESVNDIIQSDCNGQYKANTNYSIDVNNTLFIQHAEFNTHGFNAADFGLDPYRNAVILNTILKREYFKIEKNSVFQCLDCPILLHQAGCFVAPRCNDATMQCNRYLTNFHKSKNLFANANNQR